MRLFAAVTFIAGLAMPAGCSAAAPAPLRAATAAVKWSDNGWIGDERAEYYL